MEELSLFQKTWRKWREDNATGFAASLAYYSLFSIVPLLVVLVATIGSAFGQDLIRGEAYKLIAENVGADVAQFISGILMNTAQSRNILAAIISGALTIMGALGIFVQLRRSLNKMWNCESKIKKDFLRARLSDAWLFLMIFVIGIILVFSAVAGTAISTLYSRISSSDLDLRTAIVLSDILGSLILSAFLVYCVFRFMPNEHLPKKHLLLGSFFTAALFSLGKLVLNAYFQLSQTVSVYGKASSLIILLLWVYYSAQIFYFGAEFTYIYSKSKNRPSSM